MRKVMLFIYRLDQGGAARAMLALADRLVEDGYDVTLVTIMSHDEEYGYDDRIRRYVIDDNTPAGAGIDRLRGSKQTASPIKTYLRRYPRILDAAERAYAMLEGARMTRKRFAKAIGYRDLKKNIRLARAELDRAKHLRTLVEEEEPDILLSFLQVNNYQAVIATLGSDVNCAISVRNVPEKEYPGLIRGMLAKTLLPMADGAVFQTAEARDWFPGRLRRRSSVIRNIPNERFFHIDRRPEEGLIVCIARLVPQKNIPILIGAFDDIAAIHPNARLEIYGDGDDRELLEELISDMAHSDRMRLMGQTWDVASVLSRADLFVLPSKHEGMPNALMEAMAAGVPCIATDCPCGGPRELMGSAHDAGLLVPVDSIEALACAMDIVLSDSELKTALGEGAQRASQSFSPDVVYEDWKSYLEEVAAR